jgi:hypothetical protein
MADHGGNDKTGPVSRPRVLFLGLLFCLTRMVILPFPQPTSDVGIYARYVHEYDAARRAGIPFYEFHTRAVQDETERARAEGRLVGPREEYKDVEYPPLAVAIMRLPQLLMGGDSGEGPLTPAFERHYYVAFRLSMAAVDLILFVLLLWWVPRLFPQEGSREQTKRLLVYLASTAALWHLLYDRLDLLVAFLVMLALTLSWSRRHYAWSFVVLALGINFKVTPLVLAPVWVLSSLPVEHGGAFFRPRTLVALGTRTLLLGGMVLVCFFPFYLLAGEQTLAFLTYHRGRGIEIGSAYGSVLLAQQAFGVPVALNYSYGSIDVTSPFAPTLVGAAPWLAAGVLLAATAGLLFHFQWVTARGDRESPDTRTLAQAHPLPVLSYTLLLLMLFIATNKVFSPQYLLWLIPLVCLAPVAGRLRRFVMGCFILVCAVSTVLVPFLFTSDLLDPTAPDVVPLTLRGPTMWVSSVSVARNVLFLLLTLGVAGSLLAGRRNVENTTLTGEAPPS